MDWTEYREFLVSYSTRFRHTEAIPDARLVALSLGLAGEAGEVTELIKKYIRDGSLDKEHLTLELGDVLAYVVLLSQYFGLEMATVVERNVEKLNHRANG